MSQPRDPSAELGLAGETLADAVGTKREAIERGATFGRYVVLEPIGRGGMSAVYAAYDPELDRKVALKVLQTSIGHPEAHERERARLLREAQAMARLTHPNVVTVFDAGSIGDQVFIAMQFVDGTTLTQWLQRPRPWSEVVEFFVYAARGLAAAHDAGLVHRDFKPDNVLVDRDGRVRVTDFGLARPSGDTTAERLRATPLTASGRLDRAVTLAGAIVGTPAYMSPEQHLAHPVDARSDQFSLCVALWEALVGERPFAGATVGELAFAVTRGQRRAFPRESKVPQRVRRALERGLARAPAERFASLHELIAQLVPPRRRRPLLMATAAIGLLGAGALASRLTGSDAVAAPDPCAGAGTDVDAIWNPTVRASVDEALARSSSVEAGARDRALAHIDTFAEDFRNAASRACIAYRDGRESDAAFDARTACLERRRLDLRSRVGTLQQAQGMEAADALAAIYDLINPAECDETERLVAARTLPDDPELRAAVLAVEAEYIALDSERGRTDWVARTRELLVRTELLGWTPLQGNVETLLAEALLDRGEIEESEQLLRRAAMHHAQGHDDEGRLAAWVDLAYAIGVLQTRVLEARQLADVVETELARLGRIPRASQFMATLGAVRQSANDRVRARETYARALAMLDESPGSFPNRRAVILNNLGAMALVEGDAVVARKEFEAALALAREIYGDDHPRLSDNYVNICESFILQGQLLAADAPCRRALALAERPGNTDLPAIARALHSLAMLELLSKGPPVARPRALEATSRLRAAFGEGSYADAAGEELLAQVELYDGRPEQARVHARRALDIIDSLGASLHALRLRPLWLLGVIAFNEDDFAGALQLCDDALAAHTEGGDEFDPALLEPLACRGASLVRLGRMPDAIAPLERALVIQGARGGDPLAIAHAEFALAQILIAPDQDPPRARALVTAAVERLEPVRGRAGGFEKRLRAWLEEHRG
ncbi:MAG: serine/threonine-protein kinase [Nannocystaceae bacterium]|nr:serine/threonine-protein kinase [Nannocystaceae bacterium]